MLAVSGPSQWQLCTVTAECNNESKHAAGACQVFDAGSHTMRCCSGACMAQVFNELHFSQFITLGQLLLLFFSG